MMKTEQQNGWEETTLGEVMYSVSDTFNLKTAQEVHFLNTGDILDGKLLHQESSGTSNLPGQAKKSFKRGDILYSEIRPENKRFMLVDFDATNSVASTKLMVLRAKNNIDVKFLYQFLTSDDTVREFQTIAVSRSGTFPQITFDAISYFPILLPSLLEQRAIAAVLSSLDDKVELLIKQNQTLEALVQGLFREWFVDFNFPDEQGKPYKKSGGKMADSELGQVPDGWRLGKLSDEFKIIMGQSPKGESYNQDKQGMIFFQGRAEFQERFPEIRLYTTDPKRIAEKFDVLVSVRAPVGDINVAFTKCCIGRGLAAVRSDNKSYALYKIKYLQNIFQKFEAQGTVFGSIGKDDFAKIEVLIPTKEIIESFEDLARPIDQKIFNNYMQIQTLSTLRDSLLPRLMSGEVKVGSF